MSLCSVAEVRAEVQTSLSDADITSLITRVSNSVATQTGGSTSSTDTLLNLACIHLTVSAVLRKMRTTGELAARVKIGNAEQQNTIDQDIQAHETEAAKYMKKYSYSGNRGGIIYSRVGFGTVNEEL